MISGESLLRPPKPLAHDAVQKPPEAVALARGRDDARLSQLRSVLNAGPAVQRLERASAALTGVASTPLQMLKSSKGDKVDISKLPDDLLHRLAAAAVEGRPVSGYTFEPGDKEQLVQTCQRRHDESRKKGRRHEVSLQRRMNRLGPIPVA
jgi:hypothetical protein